jgi:AcrR family transcriptional regulator
MPKREAAEPSARERLLASAHELFYREGAQTVGINRIISHAGVAKASLYNIFGSKEGLVRSYLESRHAASRERVSLAVAHFHTPRERLLGVFDAQVEWFTDPGSKGCASEVASVGAPRGGAVERAAQAYREWVRILFTTLAQDAGVADPDALARQLHLLYDGAGLSARIDHDPSAATTARAAAAALLDAAPKTEPP